MAASIAWPKRGGRGGWDEEEGGEEGGEVQAGRARDGMGGRKFYILIWTCFISVRLGPSDLVVLSNYLPSPSLEGLSQKARSREDKIEKRMKG